MLRAGGGRVSVFPKCPSCGTPMVTDWCFCRNRKAMENRLDADSEMSADSVWLEKERKRKRERQRRIWATPDSREVARQKQRVYRARRKKE